MPERAALLPTVFRVLFGRADADLVRRFNGRHLAFGLICTWLVGMGRYWDDPGAHRLQLLGIGSVIYVFVLATFLWLVFLPLRPKDASWWRLLTYVTLTSPPAALYALPVERWTDMSTAMSLNCWFLTVVAAWRVTLLAIYLHRVAGFPWTKAATALMLPLAAVVTTLAALNLERAVFNFMGGFREPTANDLAYQVLVVISWLSILAAIPLFIAYVILIVMAWQRKDVPADS